MTDPVLAEEKEHLSNRVSTLNGKRAEKKRIREATARTAILKEAALITRPQNDEERLVLVKADKIRLEEDLKVLEAEMALIQSHLGEFNQNGAEEKFTEYFTARFGEYPYDCPIPSCESEKGAAKWILPLSVSVGKTLKARGDDRTFELKNHGKQWELAVELFGNPEDLRGLVLCEKCRADMQRLLERKYANEHPGNQKLYHINGFARQLAVNRFGLLRKDLQSAEDEMLEIEARLEDNVGRIASLEESIAKRVARDKEIADFLA